MGYSESKGEHTMIAFLIDADNFSAPAWIDEAFKTLEQSEGAISIRRAYGSAENLKGLADTLRVWAIRPFVNLPLPKNTTDMSLAVDAMELACLAPRPKLIVVGSGDLDFVPLVVRLRERGIKVICITERSKMAQDAVRAYDQVIYVGADQGERAAPQKADTASADAASAPFVPGKSAKRGSVRKNSAAKAVVAKNPLQRKSQKSPQPIRKRQTRFRQSWRQCQASKRASGWPWER
jgi:uncharacterized LabA/DUF88 family protein